MKQNISCEGYNQQRRKEAGQKNEKYIIPKGQRREVFLYVYYAGHGCDDGMQWFILNEATPEKCFWPAESRIRTIGKLCLSPCKLFVVYDCCRVAKMDEYKKVEDAYQKNNQLLI